MKVIIASDHAGVEYKAFMVKDLRENGYETIDMGTDGNKPTDYPDHAKDVANALIKGEGERGIIICGSGIGVSIAANKFKGIRAGVCHDTYSAHQCVEHDDANVLCLGQRVIGIELARELTYAFLQARYSNAPRHARRVEKIISIENANMK